MSFSSSSSLRYEPCTKIDITNLTDSQIGAAYRYAFERGYSTLENLPPDLCKEILFLIENYYQEFIEKKRKTESIYPIGESPFERLPPEILTNIFSFTRKEKPLYGKKSVEDIPISKSLLPFTLGGLLEKRKKVPKLYGEEGLCPRENRIPCLTSFWDEKMKTTQVSIDISSTLENAFLSFYITNYDPMKTSLRNRIWNCSCLDFHFYITIHYLETLRYISRKGYFTFEDIVEIVYDWYHSPFTKIQFLKFISEIDIDKFREPIKSDLINQGPIYQNLLNEKENKIILCSYTEGSRASIVEVDRKGKYDPIIFKIIC